MFGRRVGDGDDARDEERGDTSGFLLRFIWISRCSYSDTEAAMMPQIVLDIGYLQRDIRGGFPRRLKYDLLAEHRCDVLFLLASDQRVQDVHETEAHQHESREGLAADIHLQRQRDAV